VIAAERVRTALRIPESSGGTGPVDTTVASASPAGRPVPNGVLLAAAHYRALSGQGAPAATGVEAAEELPLSLGNQRRKKLGAQRQEPDRRRQAGIGGVGRRPVPAVYHSYLSSGHDHARSDMPTPPDVARSRSRIGAGALPACSRIRKNTRPRLITERRGRAATSGHATAGPLLMFGRLPAAEFAGTVLLLK